MGENPAASIIGVNPHDEEGEGEEEEETVHAIKLKVYQLNRKRDDKSTGGWMDLGHGTCSSFQALFSSFDSPTGMLRLKKHKESGARRLLLRNSSTGKINIVRFLLSIAYVPGD